MTQERLDYDRQLHAWVCQGNQDAFRLLDVYYHILHTWDDLIDGDKPINKVDINLAFYNAVVGLAENPFWLANAPRLTPIIRQGIVAWHVANSYEASKDEALLERSYMLRLFCGFLTMEVACIIGGLGWAVEVAKRLMADPSATDGTLTQYKEEHMNGVHV